MPKNQIYIITAIVIVVILGSVFALSNNKNAKTESVATPSSNIAQISQTALKTGYIPTLQGLSVDYSQDQTVISYPRKKLDNTKLVTEFESIAKSINLTKPETSSLFMKAGMSETTDLVPETCTDADKGSPWCIKLINSKDGVTKIEINKVEKKELKPVAFGQSFVNNGFDLKVEDVKWLDAVTSDNQYTAPLKAKAKILQVKISGVNNNKVSDFVYMQGIKAKTTADIEYDQLQGASMFSQVPKNQLPDGFGGCLSCKINPQDKAKEYIYFDFAEQPLADLYLVSGDNKVLLK